MTAAKGAPGEPRRRPGRKLTRRGFLAVTAAALGLTAADGMVTVTNETAEPDETGKTAGAPAPIAVPDEPALLTAPELQQIIAAEAEWIANSCQQRIGAGRGAIAWHPSIADQATNARFCSPYLGNRAAIAWVLHDQATGTGHYHQHLLDWVRWYLDHLNSDAEDNYGLRWTIYDYYINADTGAVSHRSSYDSADSYPATFATLLAAWVRALWPVRELDADHRARWSELSSLLEQHYDRINNHVHVVSKLLQPDNLTIARPDYAAKFTLDNVEGYHDYAALWRTVYAGRANAAREADFWDNRASDMRKAIDTHLVNWGDNPATFARAAGSGIEQWAWPVDNPPQPLPVPWGIIQTWPINLGHLSGTDPRAHALWRKLKEEVPTWYTARFPDKFAWACLGNTAALLGKRNDAETFLTSTKAHWIDAGRPWRWNAADSADRARTAYRLLQLLQLGMR